jgi:pyrroloquinoline quinone (PQQ) biosynthesis protein C
VSNSAELRAAQVAQVDFRESLIRVMERKVHWAWSHFTSGRVARSRLHVHLEQEYATYVRDFPVLVGRAYVQCPVPEVRRELAENIYEEECGGIAAGRPHPELFLDYPRGLGMDLKRFESITLLPEAAAYRRVIDETTLERGWAVAAAVTTLFIEGTQYERGEIDSSAPRRPETPLEQHPLVLHYGLPVEALGLTRAHRAVESGHRQAAWRVLLKHVPDRERPWVLQAMEEVLAAWLHYRDGVAHACGVVRDSSATRTRPARPSPSRADDKR